MRLLLRLSDDEDGREGGGVGLEKVAPARSFAWPAPASLLLLTSPSCSEPSLPASDSSPLPPTDSLALLQGLKFEKNVKEDNYGRVLALPVPVPLSSSSISSSSFSSASSFSLPRPSPLDLKRDEESVLILETEIRAQKADKVRPRRSKKMERRSFFRRYFLLSLTSLSTAIEKTASTLPRL